MKSIYFFDRNQTEGHQGLIKELGGKGAYLAQMSALGIPVPPGFTITTLECLKFLQTNSLSEDLKLEIKKNIQKIETAVGRVLGDCQTPLLLSVRSGASVSMPGMMETILNLGLNDETVQGLAQITNNPRFAYDSYRRFLQMYGHVVLNIESGDFEKVLQTKKKKYDVQLDSQLSEDILKEIIEEFNKIILEQAGEPVPHDVWAQLDAAIGAVFESWNLNRAAVYRNIHGISHELGTACTIQSMVFGNMGNDCATGVAFTRNPSTGVKELYGEFLQNAQGEDVVAGVRIPSAILDMKDIFPQAYGALERVAFQLEKHFRDVQDLEFTIQNNSLYLLQTRSAKRSARALLKTSVDMACESLIEKKEAVMRVKPSSMDHLLHPTIDPVNSTNALTKGLAASPGAVSGMIALSCERALSWAAEGKDCILLRHETSPEDIEGMNASCGILTACGGMTSHAAVVTRGMGKPCIVGCSNLEIHEKDGFVLVDKKVLREGEQITIDGGSGEVYEGRIPTIASTPQPEFFKLLSWADDIRKLKVRANADTPADARRARELGAQRIGLCRTEHMFFEKARIRSVRHMILSHTSAERKEALSKILPYQKEDFIGVFQTMEGLPVTVRLLDPPLHEFLPKEKQDIENLSHDFNVTVCEIERRIANLHEFNPMLGHRGCRLGVTYPEIYDVQVQALMEAACIVKKDGKEVKPEIMIPLVSNAKEFEILEKRIRSLVEKIQKEYGLKFSYLIGTMIELPRAALTAGAIAQKADFFSFGTNDLTQTTYGISRDDGSVFLKHYVDQKIFKNDPFVSIDVEGVGKLVQVATKEGRAANSKLKVGVCGEHGGDPDSIQFFHVLGLDYVSCSPYRVPVARLACAHAVLLSHP
ncbi:MAG: pyruvate, phosphate dikinase [Deltaproteobacteria bacterium]|nr:pyruvate, phosphate dikinase [Deltaproteobacteria bacterium]